MQRHHRSRHRWMWIVIAILALSALGSAVAMRPSYDHAPAAMER